MRAYVGVTDSDWLETLVALEPLDEVNFWQPSPSRGFKALSPGELFLFKPHRRHVIVGGGFFSYWTRLPHSIAWDAFGPKNGAATLAEMRARIERYRKTRSRFEDYEVGCIMLTDPFFLAPGEWVGSQLENGESSSAVPKRHRRPADARRDRPRAPPSLVTPHGARGNSGA